MELDKLDVYQIARELSKIGWNIYKGMKSEHRFSIGQQFINAIDSIGANIAEGFGRYHYLDSVKFYYNARGSLWESKHWTELLYERCLIAEETYKQLSDKPNTLGIKLNNFVSSIKSKATTNKTHYK